MFWLKSSIHSNSTLQYCVMVANSLYLVFEHFYGFEQARLKLKLKNLYGLSKPKLELERFFLWFRASSSSSSNILYSFKPAWARALTFLLKLETACPSSASGRLGWLEINGRLRMHGRKNRPQLLLRQWGPVRSENGRRSADLSARPIRARILLQT